MITITEKGSFDNTERYLKRLKTGDQYSVLAKYGSLGVNALSNATPVDSGRAASSWYFTIVRRNEYYSISWHNNDIENGLPVIILIQYGHGTGTGGYVQGRDFIMPAIRPIFDQIEAEAWKEVTRV
jgi:hypothetical protein